ncbi:MAG: HD domain-containing protein, partial [Proteobacteria bacterium]|nr:HD domain-containing protein [Pseudomonadota bacterium]
SEQLQRLSFKERVEKLGLREDRADVIIPAVIVMQAVLRHAEVERLLIPRVSLKDGVMLALLEGKKPHTSESHRRQVIAFAQELGKRFGIEEEHAQKVQALALTLFDRTAAIHKLQPQYRLLLEVASYLHDIGYAININDHHKHGAYILRSTPYVGISERDKAVVAAVVRYHRKGAPKPDHPEISVLDRRERDAVSKLAALVRIAEALDKGHTGAVRSVEATLKAGELSLVLHGDGDLLLERWALHQKKEFFEDVYNVKVAVAESS